jgi:hypothetical protein
MFRNRKPSITGSQTGEMPTISENVDPHEPPMPRDLPEFPDFASTTGKFRVVSEHDDAARLKDDSATSSADPASNRN